MPVTVAQVVGANLARIRDKHGLTLEEIARYSHTYGLRWNTARVSRIDRGEGSLNLETALMLSAILSAMTGQPVSVGALLETDEPVTLTPRATLKPNGAQILLSGEGATELDAALEEYGSIVSEQSDEVDEIMGAYAGIVVPAVPEVLSPDEAQTYFVEVINRTLSDERNARTLDLTDAEFSAWSVRLWGHLMSTETEKRAPEGATAQKKGRITRELMAEMREAVERGRGND